MKFKDFINERKFDLGSGTMGYGVVIWNRAKEVHGDYEKIAHIDRNRKIKYYIKNPPKQVKDYVEKIAKGKNFAATTSQPHMKVFKEQVNEKVAVIDTGSFGKGKDAQVKNIVKAIEGAGWKIKINDNDKNRTTIEVNIDGPKNERELMKKLKSWDIVTSDFR